MRITAVINVMDGARWVGYSLASIYHAVDKIIIGHGPSSDNTKEIIDALVKVDPLKIEVYDEIKKMDDPIGSSGLKNRLFRRGLRTRPDWFLHMDHDQVFYSDVIKARKKLDFLANDPGVNTGIVRSGQIFLYAKDKPNGTPNIPMKTPVVNKFAPVDQFSFITFIRAYSTIRWTQPAHEVLEGVPGEDIAMRSIQFVHTGPLDPEEVTIQKRINYYRIENLSEKDLTDDVIRDRLIEMGEISPDGNSALKHRMKNHEVKDVDFAVPEVLWKYNTGGSDKDIDWLKKYLTR